MASNDLNNLQIKITADATPAIQALKSVGKHAIDTKWNLDELTKSTSTFNDELRRTSKLIKGLKQPDDLFGFKQAYKELDNIKAKVSEVDASLGTTSGKFLHRFKAVDKRLGGIVQRINKIGTKEIFTIGSSTMKAMDRIDRMLDHLDKDYNKRRYIILEERDLLREKERVYQYINSLKQPSFQSARDNIAHTLKDLQGIHALLANMSKDGTRAFRNLKKLSKTPDINGQVVVNNSWSLGKSYMGALERNTRAIERNSRYTERMMHTGLSVYLADHARQLLGGAYDRVSELQKMRARVDAWGLSKSDRAMFEKQTNDLLKNNPLINKADAYSMMMSAASSIGHYDPKVVGQTVNDVTKYAQMERALGYNVSDISDIAKNYYGVAEARQVVGSIEKTLETFKTVFRITTTTAGKITVGDIETILRNMGQGAATISDEGLLRLLAYAEQIKVAGRGSAGSAGAGISTVGTNVKMLQLMGMGKPSSIHAKKMIAELGLLEDDAYIPAKGGIRFNFHGQEGSDEAVVFNALQRAPDPNSKKEQEKLRQVIGNVALGKLGTFASTGFYDKETAQKDPVKFVSQMVDLIDSYVVQKKKRSEYFGQYADGKEEWDDQKFLDSLSDEQLMSAMTTFWSKTGLSQRVVNALTTFSNKNFIERSSHMMQTALRQKSANEIMKQQIEDGNLMLATQRIQKAVDDLVMAFEPLGGQIGKAIYWMSNFVDQITNFVNRFQGLANLTAMWLLAKAVQGMVNVIVNSYDLIYRGSNMRKRTAVADAVVGATEVMASGGGKHGKYIKGEIPRTFNADNAVTNYDLIKYEKEQTKLNRTPVTAIMGAYGKGVDAAKAIGTIKDSLINAIAKIGTYAIRTLNGIGIALIAIDFVSFIWTWVREWKIGLTTVGEEFDKVYAKFKKLDVIKNVDTFGKDLLTEDSKYKISQNEKTLRGLYAKRDALKEEITDAESVDSVGFGDVFSGNAFKKGTEEIKARKKALEELEERIKALENHNQALRDQPVTALKSVDEKIEEIQKIGEGLKITDLLKKFEAKKEYLNEAKTLNDNANGKDEELKARYESAKKGFDEISEELNKAVNDGSLATAITELERTLHGLVNDDQKEIALKRADDAFVGIFGSLYQDLLKTSIGSVRERIAYGNADAKNSYTLYGVTQGQVKADYAANKDGHNKFEEKAPTVQPLPETQNLLHVVRLQSHIKDLENRLTRANTPAKFDQYGQEYKSFDQIYNETTDKFYQDLISGRYRRSKTDQPFLKDLAAVGRESYERKDFDLNIKDKETGKTGWDIINQEVYVKIAEQFAERLRAATGSIVASLKKTAYSIEDAYTGLDELSARYAPSQNIRDFDRETNAEISRITGGLSEDKWSKTMKAQIGEYKNKRERQRAQLSELNLIGQMKTSKDSIRENEKGGRTEREQKVFDYNRTREIRKAEFERAKTEFQNNTNNLLKLYKDGSKEREKIDSDAKAKLKQAQDLFNQEMLEMERNHKRDLYGVDSTHIRGIVQNWQDTAEQMRGIQTEMMEGFVEANEKWLDGDLNSWRDYANSLLKLWRNMVLKQGYSKLLGGVTEYVTGGIGDFVSGVFGHPFDTKGKDGKPDPKTGKTDANNQPGMGYQWGSAIYNTAMGGWDWAKQKFGWGQQPAQPNGATPTVGAPTTGTPANGAGQVAGAVGNVAGAGVSSAIDSAAKGGSEAVNKTMGALADTTTETASALTNVATQSGVLTDTVVESTTQVAANNVVQTVSNTLNQAKNTEDILSTGLLKTFNLGLTQCIAALAEFWATLKASQAANTATSMFANGGIMTSSGALPLKMYANGGIARSAQVAVFGEGRMPEAYVPLPDGRSIPVTINAGSGMPSDNGSVGGNNVVISINVTNNGSSSSEQESENTTQDTSNFKQLANNIKTMVKQEIVNQSRPGGLLYNGR